MPLSAYSDTQIAEMEMPYVLLQTLNTGSLAWATGLALSYWYMVSPQP